MLTQANPCIQWWSQELVLVGAPFQHTLTKKRDKQCYYARIIKKVLAKNYKKANMFKPINQLESNYQNKPIAGIVLANQV